MSGLCTCGSQDQRLTVCLVLLSGTAEKRAENTPVLESCANAMIAIIQACCALPLLRLRSIR